MSGPTYTRECDDVLAAERERIVRQRAGRGVGAQPLCGLALSGGGIRSASFGLGVLQALAACGLFHALDYLSTVSGGGYTGTALTWFLRNGRTTFPFAKGGPSTPLDRLRRQADYLRPTAGLTLGALFAVVLQHAFLSLAVYGGVLVGFFFLLDVVDQAMRPVQALVAIYTVGPWTDRIVLDANALLLASAACVLLLVVQSIWLPIGRAVGRLRTHGSRSRESAYVRRRSAGRRAGVLLQTAVVTFVVGMVPLASRALSGWTMGAWGGSDVVLGLGVLAGLVVVRARPSLGAPLTAFGILYALLLVTHAVASGILFGRAPWMIWVVGGGAILLGGITSLEAQGSEDVYRDRLMETFMPDTNTIASPHGLAAREAASYALASACGPETTGPYHLLNAALLTGASRATRRRQRGADAFLLSPLYCGSEATGWRATASWKHGTMTLASAMATSAAAIDPHAATAGQGATRGPLLSTLLALLGLRLGHVTSNPAFYPPARRRWLVPNLLVPGIAQALLGHTGESGPWVTLADGGDFDELGIYELVRRRVEVILAVDATEDGGWTFAALGNAVERVRVDFGVEITFHDLEDLSLATSPRAHAVGRVQYPPRGGAAAFDGVIVYVKARMLTGAAADVMAHARRYSEFPNESTFDQFFDEGTFEAYRALGWLAVHRMVEDPMVARVGLPQRRPIDQRAF